MHCHVEGWQRGLTEQQTDRRVEGRRSRRQTDGGQMDRRGGERQRVKQSDRQTDRPGRQMASLQGDRRMDGMINGTRPVKGIWKLEQRDRQTVQQNLCFPFKEGWLLTWKACFTIHRHWSISHGLIYCMCGAETISWLRGRWPAQRVFSVLLMSPGLLMFYMLWHITYLAAHCEIRVRHVFYPVLSYGIKSEAGLRVGVAEKTKINSHKY